MSSQSNTKAPQRSGVDPQEQAVIAAGIFATILMFVITPIVGFSTIAIAVASGLTLRRGVIERRQVIAGALVSATALAVDWRFASGQLAGARQDFRATLGGGGLAIHWSWLVAAFHYGIPLGLVGGLGFALGWDRQDVTGGRHTLRPVKVTTRRVRDLERLRADDQQPAVALGINERGGPATLPIGDLTSHTLILGGTGTGKTNDVYVIAREIAFRRGNVLVINGKGDAEFLQRMQAVGRSAGWGISWWSIHGPSASWNPLAQGGPTELKDKLIGMEEWTEPHYKRAAERHLQKLFGVIDKTPLHSRRDLPCVVELLNVGKLRERARQLPEPDAEELHNYLDALSRDQLSAISGLQNRLALITESEIGDRLRAGEGGIDITTALTKVGVTVFNLDSGTHPELVSQLGALVIQDAKAAVSRRAQLEPPGPGLIIIDEFSAFDGDHILGLLARARAAGVGVVLATQELADLDRVGIGFRDQVLGNTATKIVHRQDVPGSAELVAEIIGTRQAWKETQQTNRFALLRQETGLGSRHREERFIVHPNEIKQLAVGETIVVRKLPQFDVARVRVIPLRFNGDSIERWTGR